ncbi:MAG: PHP domain-containing protein [Firmicutes bacterium]|nr:PHP domain-containing protein [Bacillota bacterium]
MNTTTPLEQTLNHPDREARLQALQTLVASQPRPEQGGWVNNHIHTCYSFSPYSPSAAVFYARREGLSTAGIMDHDSVGGCAEFTRAGAIAGMPVTAGFELRVRMDNTPFRGRTINNPDQQSIAYVAAHGIPRSQYAACEAFLAPRRELRNVRNRRMVERLNGLLGGFEIALDFDRDILPLSRYDDGGSVTERHILCGLSRAIMEKYGYGEKTAAFLQDQLGLTLSGKLQAYLQDGENPHYLYDLIGALKSGLLPRFYVDATDECPDVREFIRFVGGIGAIAAYAYLGDVTDSPTGDKKAQAFEDSYLEELFGYLKRIGFHAVTYMPSRNTMGQLRRVMALCDTHELFQISGEDINTSRQSFICPTLAQPAFRHLVAATWVLIGHEAAASRRIEDGMFSEESVRKYPSLAQRIPIFEAAGRSAAADWRSANGVPK